MKEEMVWIFIKQFDISKITGRTIRCKKRNRVRGVIRTIHTRSCIALLLKSLVIHFHDQDSTVCPRNINFHRVWFRSVRSNGLFFTTGYENGKEEYSRHFQDSFKQKVFHLLQGFWGRKGTNKWKMENGKLKILEL